MKQNFSSFLHQNKGTIVGLALAILSVMPLKSFSNGLNEASAATKAATEGAIVSYCQNNTNPDSPLAWYEKACIAIFNKQYDEAIKYFNIALELDPNYAEAYCGLGFIYAEGKQDYEEAVKYYSKAIELDPNHALAYYGLGDVYKDGKKDYEKAIKYYKIAIESMVDYEHAYRKLGIVYAELKDTKKAIECLNEALRIRE